MKRQTRPLPARSAKRAALAAERRAFVARILHERPWCEAPALLRAVVGGMEGRDRQTVVDWLMPNGIVMCRSSEVHEKLKRSRGGSITDDANVLALCRMHHEFTEAHPRLATIAGMLTPSWDA